MTDSLGGYIPPTNPLGVQAVLSEGEAWVSAEALNRFGAEFFAKVGDIPAGNVHPVPDAGAVPLDVRKLASITYIPTELLKDWTTAPDPADVARWRAETQDRHAHEDARHAELLAAGGVVAALAALHAPDNRRDCEGCDFGGYDAEAPEWPCRTWQLLDETADR